jgi:hypothetical protein
MVSPLAEISLESVVVSVFLVLSHETSVEANKPITAIDKMVFFMINLVLILKRRNIMPNNKKPGHILNIVTGYIQYCCSISLRTVPKSHQQAVWQKYLQVLF